MKASRRSAIQTVSLFALLASLASNPLWAAPPDTPPSSQQTQQHQQPSDIPDKSADADAFKIITDYQKAHPNIPYYCNDVIDSHFSRGHVGPNITSSLILHTSWSEDAQMKRIHTHSIIDHTLARTDEKEIVTDIGYWDIGGGRGGDGMRLSFDKMKLIQDAMDHLPPSISPLPEPANLVIVSVKRNAQWKTYFYDRTHLPAETVTFFKLLYDPVVETTTPTGPFLPARP